MSTEMTEKYLVRALGDLAEVRSTCGFKKALIDAADSDAIAISVLRINDSRTHWHRLTHEVYFVLDGEGMLELDGEEVPLRPGVAVLVRPGVRHSAKGDVTVLIAGAPPFRPEDMFFD